MPGTKLTSEQQLVKQRIQSRVWDMTVGCGEIEESRPAKSDLVELQRVTGKELTGQEVSWAEDAWRECYQSFHQP